MLFKLFFQLLVIRDEARERSVEVGRVIVTDKVGKFVIDNEFDALARRVDEIIVKRESIAFIVAAAPARFHVTEFQRREVTADLCKFRIDLAADLLDS